MNKEELKKLLKEANLTKKRLAEIVGITQGSINCWGTTQNIPYWVKSWLENYIEKQTLDTIKKTLKDSGVCDEV